MKTGNVFIETPFTATDGGGLITFEPGNVIQIPDDRARVSHLIEKTEEGDDKEFFLHIKSFPMGLGEKINIVTDSELREVKSKSDDLLNIFIPVANLRNGDAGLVTENPFFIRSGSEIRCSGFFDKGRVNLTSFLILAPGGELAHLFKNEDMSASNGLVIYLRFGGNVSYNAENQREMFNIDSIGLHVGTPEIAELSNDFVIYEGSDDRKDKSFRCSFTYPLGMILDANYYTMARGNILLRLNRTILEYFKEERESSVRVGCMEAIYEKKEIIAICPQML